MKKLLTMVLALTLTGTILTGCSDENDSSSSKKKETKSSSSSSVQSQNDTNSSRSDEDSATTSAPEDSKKKVSYTTTELKYDEKGQPIWNDIDDVPINKEVYKDDKITVTLTKYAVEYDDLFETYMGNVYVKIENNTDRMVQVYLSKYEINGVRMMSGWISDVTNYPTVSKVNEDCMGLDAGSMYENTGLNFDNIEKITFNINIIDDDTLEPITDPIPFEIKVK
ncbi:MAG: hypothetical protein ACI4JB_04175 [Porcipelethomonas sp.]